jgi:hypothetical protein
MGPLAFTKENTEEGFKVTGIHPMDENIFMITLFSNVSRAFSMIKSFSGC